MDSEVQDVSVISRIKRRPKAFAALLVVLFITTGVVVRPLTKRTTAVARNDEKKSVESSVGADDVAVASPKPFANSALSSTDFAPPPPSSAESRRQHPAAPSFRREPSTASKPLATRRTAAPAPRETAYDAPAFRDDVPSPQTLRDSSPPAGSASSSKSSREVIHELLHEKLLVATANRDYASVVRIASKLSVTQPSSSSSSFSSSSSSTSSPPLPLAEMPARKPDRAAPEPIAAHPELRPTASSPQPSKPATTTAAVPARARTRAAESATEMKRKATAAKRKAKVVAPKAKRAVSRAKKRSSSKTAPRSGDFIFSF